MTGFNICDKKEFRSHRKMLQTQRQIIFQDSASSLNPRMKVADIIAEPLRISHRKTERGSARKEAEFQLRYVGMESMYLDKYPAQLSEVSGSVWRLQERCPWNPTAGGG